MNAVETLREAAKALHELTAAADRERPAPWTAERKVVDDLHFGSVPTTCLDSPERNIFAVGSLPLDVALYIAAMQPRVGAAIAQLLNDSADALEMTVEAGDDLGPQGEYIGHGYDPELSVAAAILGVAAWRATGRSA